MMGLLNDLRLAARALARNRAFTTVAVLTLALGIGVTTTVFTLVDGVLIRPLPFDDSEELLALEHLGRDGADELPMSLGLYLLYAERATSLDGIGLYQDQVVNLVSGGEAERLPAQVVTPSLFGVLRVAPILGRAFTADEGVPGGPQVVVLSEGLWRTRFGADPGILGQTLDLNGVSREVVGVMPGEFGFPDQDARLWLPLAIDPVQAPLGSFGAGSVARMADGQTAASVATELQGFIGRLAQLYPDQAGVTQFLASVGLRARVTPLKDALVGDVSRALWILMGTVGFVLLIACANVANLLLVRADGRERELALRVAVGAGRGHVLRTFMSESAVLAVVGGVLGVAVAAIAVRVTAGFIPTEIPRMAEVGVNLRVLGFTAALSLSCAILFGLFPLVRYGVDDLAGVLKEGGSRGSAGGGSGNKLRSALVVAQVALALVLLVGSGLMLRSFVALRAVDPGFEVEGALVARVAVPTAEIAGWQETEDFFRQVRERLAAQPGVQAVGFGTIPLSGRGAPFGSLAVEDHPRADDELGIFAIQPFAGPGYFEAMGIELVEGRVLDEGDGAPRARSVVVSESFARQYWPDGSALGRRLGGDPDAEEADAGWYEIVGVVRDVHWWDLAGEPQHVVFYPLVVGSADNPGINRAPEVVIRTAGDPLAQVSVLRQELRALNPRIPMDDPRSLDQVIEGATARLSFTMIMLGAASGVALLLGLVGIYGVISYVVAQRTREIGVRMALGATSGAVRGMVVRQSMALVGGGVLLGLITARLMSGALSSMLYGVGQGDVLTYGTVALALIAVAAAASWVPARRAAGLDPSLALRAE